MGEVATLRSLGDHAKLSHFYFIDVKSMLFQSPSVSRETCGGSSALF